MLVCSEAQFVALKASGHASTGYRSGNPGGHRCAVCLVRCAAKAALLMAADHQACIWGCTWVSINAGNGGYVSSTTEPVLSAAE
jgi:hypothetical protein